MTGKPSLMVKTHAFGDALLVSPSAAALAGSGGRWWALAGPSTAEVWRRIPGIERVLVAPLPGSGPAGALRLAAWSLGEGRDLRSVGRCMVFQGSRSLRRWLRLMTGAPSRSTGDASLGRWEQVFPLGRDEHAGEGYARAAGVSPAAFRPVFGPVGEERERAASLLGGGRWVAVAPGGASNPRDRVPEKRWPPERFASIVSGLAKAGYGVVLIGDSGDSASSSECMAAAPAGSRVLDLCGRTSWGESAAVIEACRAFVGIDSGAAHLASAVGTPAVVIFGPTAPGLLYSAGEIEPVTPPGGLCSGCYANTVFPGCRRGRAECTAGVTVEMVMEKLEAVLDEDNGT